MLRVIILFVLCSTALSTFTIVNNVPSVMLPHESFNVSFQAYTDVAGTFDLKAAIQLSGVSASTVKVAPAAFTFVLGANSYFNLTAGANVGNFTLSLVLSGTSLPSVTFPNSYTYNISVARGNIFFDPLELPITSSKQWQLKLDRQLPRNTILTVDLPTNKGTLPYKITPVTFQSGTGETTQTFNISSTGVLPQILSSVTFDLKGTAATQFQFKPSFLNIRSGKTTTVAPKIAYYNTLAAQTPFNVSFSFEYLSSTVLLPELEGTAAVTGTNSSGSGFSVSVKNLGQDPVTQAWRYLVTVPGPKYQNGTLRVQLVNNNAEGVNPLSYYSVTYADILVREDVRFLQKPTLVASSKTAVGFDCTYIVTPVAVTIVATVKAPRDTVVPTANDLRALQITAGDPKTFCTIAAAVAPNKSPCTAIGVAPYGAAITLSFRGLDYSAPYILYVIAYTDSGQSELAVFSATTSESSTKVPPPTWTIPPQIGGDPNAAAEIAKMQAPLADSFYIAMQPTNEGGIYLLTLDAPIPVFPSPALFISDYRQIVHVYDTFAPTTDGYPLPAGGYDIEQLNAFPVRSYQKDDQNLPLRYSTTYYCYLLSDTGDQTTTPVAMLTVKTATIFLDSLEVQGLSTSAFNLTVHMSNGGTVYGFPKRIDETPITRPTDLKSKFIATVNITDEQTDVLVFQGLLPSTPYATYIMGNDEDGAYTAVNVVRVITPSASPNDPVSYVTVGQNSVSGIPILLSKSATTWYIQLIVDKGGVVYDLVLDQSHAEYSCAEIAANQNATWTLATANAPTTVYVTDKEPSHNYTNFICASTGSTFTEVRKVDVTTEDLHWKIITPEGANAWPYSSTVAAPVISDRGVQGSGAANLGQYVVLSAFMNSPGVIRYWVVPYLEDLPAAGTPYYSNNTAKKPNFNTGVEERQALSVFAPTSITVDGLTPGTPYTLYVEGKTTTGVLTAREKLRFVTRNPTATDNGWLATPVIALEDDDPYGLGYPVGDTFDGITASSVTIICKPAYKGVVWVYVSEEPIDISDATVVLRFFQLSTVTYAAWATPELITTEGQYLKILCDNLKSATNYFATVMAFPGDSSGVKEENIVQFNFTTLQLNYTRLPTVTLAQQNSASEFSLRATLNTLGTFYGLILSPETPMPSPQEIRDSTGPNSIQVTSQIPRTYANALSTSSTGWVGMTPYYIWTTIDTNRYFDGVLAPYNVTHSGDPGGSFPLLPPYRLKVIMKNPDQTKTAAFAPVSRKSYSGDWYQRASLRATSNSDCDPGTCVPCLGPKVPTLCPEATTSTSLSFTICVADNRPAPKATDTVVYPFGSLHILTRTSFSGTVNASAPSPQNVYVTDMKAADVKGNPLTDLVTMNSTNMLITRYGLMHDTTYYFFIVYDVGTPTDSPVILVSGKTKKYTDIVVPTTLPQRGLETFNISLSPKVGVGLSLTIKFFLTGVASKDSTLPTDTAVFNAGDCFKQLQVKMGETQNTLIFNFTLSGPAASLYIPMSPAISSVRDVTPPIFMNISNPIQQATSTKDLTKSSFSFKVGIDEPGTICWLLVQSTVQVQNAYICNPPLDPTILKIDDTGAHFGSLPAVGNTVMIGYVFHVDASIKYNLNVRATDIYNNSNQYITIPVTLSTSLSTSQAVCSALVSVWSLTFSLSLSLLLLLSFK